MLIEQGRVTLHEFYLTPVSFLRQVRNGGFAFFRGRAFIRAGITGKTANKKREGTNGSPVGGCSDGSFGRGKQHDFIGRKNRDLEGDAAGYAGTAAMGG